LAITVGGGCTVTRSYGRGCWLNIADNKALSMEESP
jgi:hypothetical protein